MSIEKSFLTEIPEFLKDFNNLELLTLRYNKITTLPEWLPNLPELKRLYMASNYPTLEITQANVDIIKALHEKSIRISESVFEMHIELGLPLEQIKLIREIINNRGQNIVRGDIINKLDKPLDDLYRGGILLRVFNGKIVQLGLLDGRLEQLPESFGEIESLTKVNLSENKLKSLPESFGELRELREVVLSKNQLTSLPDSFVNLTSITKLDLSDNQFKEIPTQLWALKELTDLNLSNNPLSEEEQNVIQKVPDLVRDYLKVKATIVVFISHAVIDFGPYRVGDLVDYLGKQKEISQVFFCEADLAGNIDEWMLNAVQKSQLILYIGTNKSVFNSVDCDNELQLADKFSIPVIPLKGKDITWLDLAEKNLSRELGLEYDTDNFEAFCADVYRYIENFKREINLMEKEERRLGIIDIYERFRLILDEKFSEIVRKIDSLADNIKGLAERVDNLEKRG